LYLADHARLTPDKPAIIAAESGERLTYRELDDRSNQLAQLFHANGLQRGDHIALLMENNMRFVEVAWAAFRSGLYITAVNRYLPADEAAYIVDDCGAKALVTSLAKREVAAELLPLIPNCPIRLMVDGVIPGWAPYETALAEYPAVPLAEEWMGDTMLYSSGTTGRPKGISRPLAALHPSEGFDLRPHSNRYGIDANSVYLSPAPLYRRPADLCRQHTVPRRHGDHDGEVRRRGRPALHRAVQGHPQPVGPDHVRAYAETACGSPHGL